MINSVLEKLRVRRLADIQEEISERSRGERYLCQSNEDGTRKKLSKLIVYIKLMLLRK